MRSSTPYQKSAGAQLADTNSTRFSPTKVREVWASNFNTEFAMLLDIVHGLGAAAAVALNIEFPGFLQRAPQNASQLQHYEALRENVHLLSPIQIGVAAGDVVQHYAWSFNLRFNLNHDLHMDASIKALQDVGFHFGKHANEGIDPKVFGRWLADSSLIGPDSPLWVTFGGAYDLAYLLKVLGKPWERTLPQTHALFEKTISDACPRRLELQNRLDPGALSKFASARVVKSDGQPHTAGKDAATVLEIYCQFFSHDYPMSQTTDDAKVTESNQEGPDKARDEAAPATQWAAVAKGVALKAQSSYSQQFRKEQECAEQGSDKRKFDTFSTCETRCPEESSEFGHLSVQCITDDQQCACIAENGLKQVAHTSLWSSMERDVRLQAPSCAGKDCARNVETTRLHLVWPARRRQKCSDAVHPRETSWAKAHPKERKENQHNHQLNQAAPSWLWAAAARGA